MDFRGLAWFRVMKFSKARWLAMEDAFVYHALVKVNCRNIAVEMISDANYHGPSTIPIHDEAPDLCVGAPLFDWEVNHNNRCRVELCGDSLLVVNWSQGIWPVHNPLFVPVIENAMRNMEQWSATGITARFAWAPMVRHVPRRFNTFADSLANLGKALPDCSCVFGEFEFCCEFEPRYICAFWDGAYTTGETTVGVGWWIRAADRLDAEGQPIWRPRPWFQAHGKCAGTSAAVAEVVAFQCLTLTLHRLFNNQDIDDPLPPWSENAWRFDEPEQFENLPVKLENLEDEASTIYESSSSNSSISRSSSSSSLPNHTDTDDEFENYWDSFVVQGLPS